MSWSDSLQIIVYAISIIMVLLTALLGALLFSIGSYWKIIAIWMILNLWMSTVLFYGAKTKDTTHILIWLLTSMLQTAGSLIAMCYFAYRAQELKLHHIERYTDMSENNDEEQHSKQMRSGYILYSVLFGLLPILLASMAIFVFRFYIITASQNMTDSKNIGAKLFLSFDVL